MVDVVHPCDRFRPLFAPPPTLSSHAPERPLSLTVVTRVQEEELSGLAARGGANPGDTGRSRILRAAIIAASNGFVALSDSFSTILISFLWIHFTITAHWS